MRAKSGFLKENTKSAVSDGLYPACPRARETAVRTSFASLQFCASRFCTSSPETPRSKPRKNAAHCSSSSASLISLRLSEVFCSAIHSVSRACWFLRRISGSRVAISPRRSHGSAAPRRAVDCAALSKRRSEQRQHIGGEGGGVRLGEDVLHLAVRTDDVCDALRVLAAAVVRRAVLDAHGARRIGQERVGEVELLG